MSTVVAIGGTVTCLVFHRKIYLASHNKELSSLEDQSLDSITAMPVHNSENVLATDSHKVAFKQSETTVDVYFSADVETDGPIPGPYSMLSFALVYAGTFDGREFTRPANYKKSFYAEMKPISSSFDPDAMRVNGLDRERLLKEGKLPESAMAEAANWVMRLAGHGKPVLVAYPLSFDWSWLYWYFIRFSSEGSPFNHSRCFDIKTAFAVKSRVPIASAGRSHLGFGLRPQRGHTHHALDDAIEQAEIFANVFLWEGRGGRATK